MDKKLVRVEWVDAISHDSASWIDAEDSPLSPSKCFSIGWVVAENEHSIHIAAHFSEDGTAMSGDICIPKGCVVHIAVVEVKEWT